MGLFLAASAFRNRSVVDLADTIRAYASKFGSAASICSASDPDSPEDVLIFAARGPWTTVQWPSLFNVHDVPFCLDASHNLGTLVSTVHVYDGDYWAHFLMEGGHLLDRFASWPDYFSPEHADALRETWGGDAQVIGAKVGVQADVLAAYLVHPDPEHPEHLRALSDDEFELEDVWVLTDFWRRMGIKYEEPASSAMRLRLDPDYRRRFPVSTEEL